MDRSQQWQFPGTTAPEALTDARLQLHWAAQLVASVGKTCLDPRPDDSYPNLGSDRARRRLAGHVVTARERKRIRGNAHP